MTGAADVLDVLPGDTLNGNPATLADVVISVVTPSPNPGVTLNQATGLVSVAPGTPAGSYPITYQICETLNPANCATAIATVDVIAAPIAADDDAGNSDPLGGVVAGLNVLTNDTLNGTPIVPADVTITPVTTGPLTVNADGTVTVAPGTPAGPYTVTYTVCEVLNPANCDTADVIITVNAGNITADADSVSGDQWPDRRCRCAGRSAGRHAQRQSGHARPMSPCRWSRRVPPFPARRFRRSNPATGLVSVAPGTPAGSYPITYQICETLNPTNCATAIATVDVIAAPIAAVDDAGSSTLLGGVIAGLNVLTNDTLNGTPIVPADVTIAPVTTGPLTVNADGTVTVAPGTPAGPYTVTYQVCEVLNPANCDTADVIITVNAGNIVADAELSLRDQWPDRRGGCARRASGRYAQRQSGAARRFGQCDHVRGDACDSCDARRAGSCAECGDRPDLGCSRHACGSYPITYQICETLNPANCATAIATVDVIAAPIVAADDTGTSTPLGGTVPGLNVLTNDTLNGVAIVPADVTITPVTTGPLTVNADGTVTVAPGTPAGPYMVSYKVCEVLNPAKCGTALVTVTVASGLGSLAGVIYEDTNSNDAYDPGEPVAGGYTVQLLRGAWWWPLSFPIRTARMSSLAYLLASGYTVAAFSPDGVRITGEGTIDIAAGQNVTDVNLPIDPSGIVYDAITRLPVAGATLQLTTPDGAPLPVVCLVTPAQQNQITGLSGAYRFDIAAGAAPQCPLGETEYRIAVTSPSGYLPGPAASIPPQSGALEATSCAPDVVLGGSCQLQRQLTLLFGLANALLPSLPDRSWRSGCRS